MSILGSKGGLKVTSTRRESDGARVYGSRLAVRLGGFFRFRSTPVTTSEWRK